jgi:hypothetical protein
MSQSTAEKIASSSSTGDFAGGVIPAGGDLGGMVPSSVSGLTTSAKDLVSKVQSDITAQASAAIGGSVSSVLGDTPIGGAVAGVIGGFLGGTASVIAPNPPREGTDGFTDDRVGIGYPIPGQPQKTKLDMTPFFSITNPASDYWPLQPEEMNTPRLARGVVKDTITEYQSYSRTMVATAKGFKLEPASPYAAQYPFNAVEESESGHVREVDDTPGAERIKESHRTGTFYEIHPDGGKVTKVVKDNFTAIMGDDSLQVVGDCKIMVMGSCSLFTALDVDVFATTGVKLFSPASIQALGAVDVSIIGGAVTLVGMAEMTLISGGVITMIDSTGIDVGAIDE